MISIKSMFIYLLSLKRIIAKSMKEFFYTTKFYNKLLDNKIPSRFFFYPNPYLLSPLLNHKDLLIKISNEDVRNFRISFLKNKERRSIHNFLWLNLVDRKNKLEQFRELLKNGF